MDPSALPLALAFEGFDRPRECFDPPFARCSLDAMRLLAGFLWVAEEAHCAWPALLLPSGLRCPASLAIAARADLAVGSTVDGILAALVGSRARGLETRGVAALAGVWSRHGRDLQGLDLVALLWRIARDPAVAMRPLERRIAREVDPEDLLNPLQRAGLGMNGCAESNTGCVPIEFR
ncbi:MAG: hypothetical protein AAF430_05195 [Myxococcota bacterium]